MMKPVTRPDASLTEFLAARARAAPDGRLVVDVIIGSLAALGVAAWRPTGWLGLVGVAVCLAAFGLWGIIDRELRERAETPDARMTRLLAVLRVVVAGVGVLAVVAAMFTVLGISLGTWIS